MQKITMRTAGLPLPGRKRAPDIDHATQLLDLTSRGYNIGIMSDETPWWNIYCIRHNGRAFANQPEGTEDTLFLHITYANEDARLSDKPFPEWIDKLVSLLNSVAPSTLYIRTGSTHPKETPS